MAYDLMSFSNMHLQKYSVDEIIACNEITSPYGLILTPSQAIELVETRDNSLQENGRVEFGSGIIDKIIKRFCDSPYINMYNYPDTLHELIDLFYYYKNEALDLISDDELLEFMYESFNGICRGSLELLSNRELERMAHNLRFGLPADYDEKELEDEEYDEY